ncbi:zinc fingers and homeoboxes protein 3-like [Scleropages formosus]|uniref:Zinc fingers and homeoboxes protein 3-like n=1 Tax=Scleropages formosus TaxID=113540 RepID=A0A0P7XFQ6_SCLFO|nr:zinc fingers and homeoboxes protein 3-like [Scleropages formosus]
MHVQEDKEQEESLSDCKMSHSTTFLAGEGMSSQEVGETFASEGGSAQREGGAYTCPPCSFESHDLNLFLDHVYSSHTGFRAEPSFICVDCGVSATKFEGLALHNAHTHPSTVNTTLQVKKRDRRIIVEQILVMNEGSKESEISITKTPIMKMLKGKSEPKRIVVSHAADDLDTLCSKETEKMDPPAVTHVPTIVHNGASTKSSVPTALQVVNGSGALPMLKTAITQVVSVVQNRTVHQQSVPLTASATTSSSSSPSSSTGSRNLPKVMIPLSSIPTYNAAMDTSSFLKNSFSKFPYPTKAELCYLTVVTKYPEEQIKIWFTAQRLKQGISWSPEEIEDARRKMFNTIIQTAPSVPQQPQQRHSHHSAAQPTITVLPASLGPSNIPHILQGSLVGQGGVIVTQPMVANGIQEQLSALKQSFIRCQFPNQEEVERLTKITGLTVREVRKWFSDRRYHYRNLKGSRSSSGSLFSGNSLLDFADSPTSSDTSKSHSPLQQQQQQMSPPAPHPRRVSRQQTPDFTAIRYKERDPHQVRALEASFSQNPMPSGEEVDRLRAETKMTRREIDGWFSERRKKVAAEKKREEAEKAEREEDGEGIAEEDMAIKEESSSSQEDALGQQQTKDEKQKDDTLGSEPKVNPIKINLKMLKVTESNSKAEAEVSPPRRAESPKTPPSSMSTRGKKTPDQLHLLKQVFARTQWPSSPQYDELIAKTGLPRPEVVRWFGDSRYVYKNGQLKWLESYQQMAEEEDYRRGDIEVLKKHLTTHGKLEEEHVKGLVESSHLNEELVRRWFATRSALMEGKDAEELDGMEPTTTLQQSHGESAGSPRAPVTNEETAYATEAQSVNPEQGKVGTL